MKEKTLLQRATSTSVKALFLLFGFMTCTAILQPTPEESKAIALKEAKEKAVIKKKEKIAFNALDEYGKVKILHNKNDLEMTNKCSMAKLVFEDQKLLDLDFFDQSQRVWSIHLGDEGRMAVGFGLIRVEGKDKYGHKGRWEISCKFHYPTLNFNQKVVFDKASILRIR